MPIVSNFTLKKTDRLKSQKLIEFLFSYGKSYSVYPIKALFLYIELPAGLHLQAGFAVSKKGFKRAVDRNRIKRIVKESYRLQKNDLQKELRLKNRQLAVFFLYTGKDIPLTDDIMKKIGLILTHLHNVTMEENK